MLFQPLRWSFTFAVVSLLCFGPMLMAQSAATKQRKDDLSPAQIREALKQNITLDYESNSIQDAIAHLRSKTKIPFTLDPQSLANLGMNDNGNNVVQQISVSPPTFRLKVVNTPVRIALRKMLAPFNMRFAILGDSVLIASDEQIAYRQFSQCVDVDTQAEPLAKVLQKLSEETGINVMIDQRVERQAERAVTARFEDVPIDIAVRLVCEVVNLKVMKLANLLLVTTPENAWKLRQEEADDRDASQGGPNPPYGPPVVPPAGGMGPGRGIFPAPPPVVAPPLGAPLVQPAGPARARTPLNVGRLTTTKAPY
jgi:hypothetical protein